MSIYIEPAEAVADEVSPLCIKGLEPRTVYSCRFSLEDRNGNIWESTYSFPSNAHREINVSKLLDHPLAFIRDMRSEFQHKFDQNGADPLEIQVLIEKDDEIVFKKTIRRIYVQGVQRIDIRNNEVYGYGYYPKEQCADAAVVLFSGSGGGLGEARASLYASRGILTFSIPYFKHEGLPDTLENINLEYFQKAISHLKKNCGVKKLVAIGTSRGGELVLLLASLFSDLFDGIIAIVPSSATYGGMPNLTKPAWLFDNKSFPIAPFPTGEEITKEIDISQPVCMTPFILKMLAENEDAYKKAEIAVENIKCPMQLISAKEDMMWPSTEYCNRIVKRLTEHNRQQMCVHHAYDGAGHIILHPYIPTTCNFAYHPLQGIIFDNGGDPIKQFQALEDAWKQNLAFIHSI